MISVIVPVFNCESFIDKCVQSILKQTYDNLEVILIDDGSTDSSSEKCDIWQQKDSRVRVIHRLYGGVSRARNTGLKLASGEYIAFVDADDIIHPQMYEMLHIFATRHDLDLAVCKYKSVTDTDIQFETYDTSNFDADAELFTGQEALNGFYEYYQLRLRIPIWCKLYRKNIAKEVSFAEGRIYEDEIFLHDIIGLCDKIGIIDTVLHFYYQSPNSITRSGINIRRLDLTYALRDRFLFFKELGITSQTEQWGKYYISIALKEWHLARKQKPEYTESYKEICLKRLYEDRKVLSVCRLSPFARLQLDYVYRYPEAVDYLHYCAVARLYRKLIKNPIEKRRKRKYIKNNVRNPHKEII